MKRKIAFLVVFLLLIALQGFAIAKTSPQGSAGSWQKIVSGGFGAGKANAAAGPMVVYNGKLYTAVANDSGVIVKVKDGSTWKNVNSAGFGDPNNKAIGRMVVYNGKIYAGTENSGTTGTNGGCQIWSYDGSTWKEEVGGGASGTSTGPGFGKTSNIAVSAMAVFGSGAGDLYVGTSNYVLNPLSPGSDGAEIWKFDGTNWTNVAQGGFGDTKNIAVSSLYSYGGSLYAGTARAEISVSVIDLSHVRVIITSKGCEFRKYAGGSSWSLIKGNGITDTKNVALVAMREYGGTLYLGTTNGDASFVYDISKNEITDYTYTTNGLCIYKYLNGSISTFISGGFDSKNEFTVSGFLDVTVGSKNVLLIGVSQTDGPAKLKVYNGKDIFAGADDGFGNSNNTGITGLASLEGYTYVGTGNDTDGCEIWYGNPPTEKPTPYYLYLAEGSTDWGFSTYITIENPNNTSVPVKVTYQTSEGEKAGPSLTMPALSQATINPAETLGSADFSTKIECTSGLTIAADRTMLWNSSSGEEGHSSVAVTSPAKVWYLPEGSSKWGFECFLLIQNPNTTTAHVTITYMTQDQGPKEVRVDVPASSRRTYNMASHIGEADSSIKVTSDIPVIPERAMYRNSRREGHDSIGTTLPASDYYLAEGAVGWDVGFETWVLVQNPNDTETQVSLTFMTQSGQVEGPNFKMAPNSRQSLKLNNYLPQNTDVSTHVHGNNPIIAERAMYWTSSGQEVCHDSIGMDSAHTVFYLPDGWTDNGRETWTLVQNPNSTSVEVEISYLTPTGKGNVTKTETIPANSRKTFNMIAHSGIQGRAAIMVRSKTSGKKIMVERAMYWNGRGAGTDTIGGYSD